MKGQKAQSAIRCIKTVIEVLALDFVEVGQKARGTIRCIKT